MSVQLSLWTFLKYKLKIETIRYSLMGTKMILCEDEGEDCNWVTRSCCCCCLIDAVC